MAQLLGALIITFAVSRLIGLAIKRRLPDPTKLVVTNLSTLALATLLAGYGNARAGEPPVFAYAFGIYLLPVLAWAIYDLVRWRLRRATGSESI